MPDPEFDPAAEQRFVDELLTRKRKAMDRFEPMLANVAGFLRRQNARWGTPLQPDELEDLQQDVTVAIFRSLGSYRPLRPIEAWMFGVCANQFRAAIRDKQRRASRFAPLAADPAVDSTDPEVEPSEWERFEQVLESIGGHEADIIRSKLVDEQTFAEIAARLSLPVNTVKTRFYRGLDRVKWRMEPERGAEG